MSPSAAGQGVPPPQLPVAAGHPPPSSVARHGRQTISKILLIAAPVLFGGAVGLVADRVARNAMGIGAERSPGVDLDPIYWLVVNGVILFALLTTLPLLMIITYHGLNGNRLRAKVASDLALCALSESQLAGHLARYEEANDISAFVLPAIVNFFLLALTWDICLLDQGPIGLVDLALAHPEGPISLAVLLPKVAAGVSPLGWTLLGAYYYGLGLILRRWMLTDLTTNVLWKLNIRLVVAFVLGLLLTGLASGPLRESGTPGMYLDGFAFLVGLVPDLFLRWLSQQLRRLGGVDTAMDGRMLTPSDLQSKIDGLSFWQLDRLGEEGIESVQDLAMKEIPSLLIRTRFDVPLLLNWVDRALLCAQLSQGLERFKEAHIYTATDFKALAEREAGVASLVRSLENAGGVEPVQPGSQTDSQTDPGSGSGPRQTPARVTADTIANILTGLSAGPNLRHLTVYRAKVNSAEPAAVDESQTSTPAPQHAAAPVDPTRPPAPEPYPQSEPSGHPGAWPESPAAPSPPAAGWSQSPPPEFDRSQYGGLSS